VLLNCTNTRHKRRGLRHAFYYLLNIVSLRTARTRSVPLPDQLQIADRVDFEAAYDGAWQRLPPHVLQKLAEWRPQVAIKFGMGLLRVPEELQCKILSYHHGDPRRFRGRPAGFYEMLAGEAVVGQIVQIISDRLDGGAVVAFAETRVQPHSYRATMSDAYGASPLLIRSAVANCLAGRTLPLEPSGRNYRLPSNWTVLRFAARSFAAKVRRLLYGGFFEKEWQVGVRAVKAGTAQQLVAELADRSLWNVIPRPAEYRFLADPFPHPDGGFLVEALRRSDGQGEIVHIGSKANRVLCRETGHFSYPATVRSGGDWFILPEVAEWSAPRLYRVVGGEAAFAGELNVGGRRIVDATLHATSDAVYLFGSEPSEGAGVLRLWAAEGLFSRFTEHPASPIRISPVGARMAGGLLEIDGRLYRAGQDGSRGYGRGTILFEVTALSPTEYEETRVGEIYFDGVRGPHTINVRGDQVVFDFYEERFTPFAGIDRLRARAAKRKARRTAKPLSS